MTVIVGHENLQSDLSRSKPISMETGFVWYHPAVARSTLSPLLLVWLFPGEAVRIYAIDYSSQYRLSSQELNF